MSKLYPDFGHPKGIGARPWFTIRGDKLYPAFGHPEGIARCRGSKSGRTGIDEPTGRA